MTIAASACLWVDGDRVSVLVGGAELAARDLDAAAVGVLEGVAERYRLLMGREDRPALYALGRELWGWLDGDAGAMARLKKQAPKPLLMEISGPAWPSSAEWALLRAPFEVLADPEEGFWAEDARLGFAPFRRLRQASAEVPAPDSYRLGLAFMAAAPRGQRELDYEAEEAAILRAVRPKPGAPETIDLVVEDSGALADLVERAAGLPAMHLSCHGHNAWKGEDGQQEPRPVVFLEDEGGRAVACGVGELARDLRKRRPRLLFLSACLTSADRAGPTAPVGADAKRADAPEPPRAKVAESLVTGLVQSGLPAVVGWEGSVGDRAATRFAAAFYARLNAKEDVATALADARRAVLAADDERVRADWHLARLWVDEQGGGPVVAGTRKRSLIPTGYAHKHLGGRKDVPVASSEMFVGRRRELQDALPALRRGEKAGVLLIGMGRQGKSSLAARIASRLKDERLLAVVFGRYDAMAVFDALAEAVKTVPAARDLLAERREVVRRDAAQLGVAVLDLVRTLDDTGAKPLLLVIDDLERILEVDAKADADTPYRVRAREAPVLKAVIEAFAPTLSESRLLVTSRFAFRLDGCERALETIALPPFSTTSQDKLELRQLEALQDTGKAPEALAERLALLPRAKRIAHGNPGLQDLLATRLVLAAAVPVAAATAALDEMAAWLDRGDLPAAPEVRAFLEGLAIDALLELAGDDGKELLRAATIFQLPAPAPALAALAEAVGGAVVPLEALGLLERFEDLVDPAEPAHAVNALAAGRLAPLDEAERATRARIALPALVAAWGGIDAEPGWPPAADLQAARLALAIGTADAPAGDVLAACAVHALTALRQATFAERAAFGRACLDRLEADGRRPPWRLFARTAEATAEAGDGAAADALHARAAATVDAARAAGETIEPRAAGHVVYAQAKRLQQAGDPAGASTHFEEAAALAQEAGDVISAAVARGGVADILAAWGEHEEALRIRREEELPVYERLGALRERAVTTGKIADILAGRGELDEALRIRREEQLPVYESLGAVQERAVTMGKIADILQVRGEIEEALRIRREEELPVYERLGDVRARAVTMGQIADILEAHGELDEALRIRREEQLPVYERLGDVRERAVTMGKIADILEARGELDEALRIRHAEALPVFERLGAVQEKAVTLQKIAFGLIDGGGLEQGRIQEIYEALVEAFDIAHRLKMQEGIAFVGIQLGQVLAMSGQKEQGLAVLDEAAAAFDRLGDADGTDQCQELIEQIKGA
jgi:tetratricopeptide (TPR) repeat protein